jgi:hypothetical protein
MKNSLIGIFFLILLCPKTSSAQTDTGGIAKIVSLPSRLFSRIQAKTTALGNQLTQQTESYLSKMARREAKLQKKLARIDSAGAKQLFANSPATYAALEQKMRTDTGTSGTAYRGEYNPYVDSLRTSLAFLAKNPAVAGSPVGATAITSPTGITAAASAQSLQQLQAKMQDAGAAQTYLSQRKQQISQYLSRYTSLSGSLTKEYQGYTQDLYYYNQEVSKYKAMLTQPDQLEEKALSQLNQLPAFQKFMQNNSQLSVLFGQPATPNSNTPAALAGLQTREQVGKIIQGQLATGGPQSSANVQASIQSAQQQLSQLKSRIEKYGSGGQDMDIPDFQPNEQKTKSFWKRLQLGTDFQTSRNSYNFPTITDLGLSLGYKLNNSNLIGVGASFKLGWGTDIQHISFSGQGVGLRSFVDIKIKSTFSLTGGLEYNYTTPITNLQQFRNSSYWTQSGLIGISKTVSLQNRVFKQTRVSLLWDFLSYYQKPPTQPLLFRVGYNF